MHETVTECCVFMNSVQQDSLSVAARAASSCPSPEGICLTLQNTAFDKPATASSPTTSYSPMDDCAFATGWVGWGGEGTADSRQ